MTYEVMIMREYVHMTFMYLALVSIFGMDNFYFMQTTVCVCVEKKYL